MPIYEYKCPDCERTYEMLQSIKAGPTMECECGELAHRIMSGFSIGGPKEGDVEPGDNEIVPGTLGIIKKGKIRKEHFRYGRQKL